jgi:hypothetical protein
MGAGFEEKEAAPPAGAGVVEEGEDMARMSECRDTSSATIAANRKKQQ